MRKILVANWKMNPESARRAAVLAGNTEKFARKAKKTEVIVAPPFVFLSAVAKVLRAAKLGAQDVSFQSGGAFTGEVSSRQLKSLAATHVIVGHSERRRYFGETDGTAALKVAAALRAGLKVIFCVGEPFSVRRSGLQAAQSYVRIQMKKLAPFRSSKSILVAYEPVWAIGSGNPDTPRESALMALFIKKLRGADTPVLYGGSVTALNARGFLSRREIDGALVGGASLRPEFRKIIEISSEFS